MTLYYSNFRINLHKYFFYLTLSVNLLRNLMKLFIFKNLSGKMGACILPAPSLSPTIPLCKKRKKKVFHSRKQNQSTIYNPHKLKPKCFLSPPKSRLLAFAIRRIFGFNVCRHLATKYLLYVQVEYGGLIWWFNPTDCASKRTKMETDQIWL